jgi:hypothetical protein
MNLIEYGFFVLLFFYVFEIQNFWRLFKGPKKF